jgi:phosphoribosylanthranilate isomerase
MKPLVKICGLRDAENIMAIAGLGPDLLGFIFYPPSPRFVGHGFRVPDAVPAAMRAGVFVNEPLHDVLRLAHQHRLTFVQLHGHEPPDFAAACRAEGLRVIKAVAVSDKSGFDALSGYSGSVDYLLFDTAGPRGGGHGVPFNWQLLAGYTGETPFLLSGGLKIELAPKLQSFQHARLAGYDVNSGVEERPGLKSVAKTKEMIQFLKPTDHEKIPGR